MLVTGVTARRERRAEMSERDETNEDLAEDLELEDAESSDVAGGTGIKGESTDDPHPKWPG
jgi:hypothetical protein